MDQQYEVLYIDKFTDGAKAEFVRNNLRQTFHLNNDHLDRLSTGQPVIIKKQVSFDEAIRYREAVVNAGGVACVQALDENGMHHERRQNKRRQVSDRRTHYRASSIQPDRRQNCGRRSTDGATFH